MGKRNKRGSKPALRVVLLNTLEQEGRRATTGRLVEFPTPYRCLTDVEALCELNLAFTKLLAKPSQVFAFDFHDDNLRELRRNCQCPLRSFFRNCGEMSVDLEIASRLREARRTSGYDSSAEAADAMDLAYTTYASHENGGRGVPAKSLSRYAAFYRVNLLWLAEGRGPMRGKAQDNIDILAGLPAEARQLALDYIEFLKAKFGI